MTASAATAPAPARTRVPRSDIALLRVVAICGVVLIHVSGLTVIQVSLHGQPVWWVAKAMNAGTRWCVPLFVMVSGALLLRGRAQEPLSSFYRRRLDRLLPAIVVWHVVYIVFEKVVLHSKAGVLSILAALLAGRTYTALYFFWLILGLYLVAPALRKVVADLSPDQLLRLGVALVAVTCAWQSTTAFISAHSRINVVATPTVFTYWVPYVGYFVLGAALAERAVSRRTALLAGAGWVAATVVTIWQSAGHGPAALSELTPVSYHGWLVAASTASLFLLVAGLLPAGPDAPGRVLRLVAVLANLTLGVFAMHLLVLYGLQHAGLMSVTKGASRLRELAYLTVGTLAISFALAWVLSRVPVLRRLV